MGINRAYIYASRGEDYGSRMHIYMPPAPKEIKKERNSNMAKIFIETHSNGTPNHRELHSGRDVTFHYRKLNILVVMDTVEGVVLRADFIIRRYCR